MSDLTREDLKTILIFALHVARVDDNLAGIEKSILGRYIELTQLDEGERADLLQQRHSLSDDLSHLSGEEAKTLLVKTICAIAHADGVMHDTEDSFIRKVNHQLGDVLALPPFDEWGAFKDEVLFILGTLD